MNELDEIDIDVNSKKDEKKHMLSYVEEDYIPIQKNTRLFKFILYSSKIEIKANSLMKMIYTTSLFEIFLWIVGFLLFMESPGDLYLIWVLIVHLFKGILGLSVLNKIPKTYEIIENISKNPNFDEDKIMDLITIQIRETFIDRWSQNKKIFLYYLITTLFSLLVDIIIFIVEVAIFGNRNKFIMETSLLTITFVFIGNLLIKLASDIVYFLWFITLRFSLPDYMVNPIKNAIIGSIIELKDTASRLFRKQQNESDVT
jgi:hypothetical protein